MIEEGSDRRQILTQIAAVKAAVDQVGLKLISEELRRCQLDGEAGCQERFEDALGSLLRYATLAR
jgi:DNA-binding FrmR family transcriptional regulator